MNSTIAGYIALGWFVIFAYQTISLLWTADVVPRLFRRYLDLARTKGFETEFMSLFNAHSRIGESLNETIWRWGALGLHRIYVRALEEHSRKH